MATDSFWDMLVSHSKVAGSPLVNELQPLQTNSSTNKPAKTDTKEFKMCIFINTCVMKLDLHIDVRCTACWLFHKFCKAANVDDYDEYIVAMTCIFLAAKLEESHVKIRDVINVAYRTKYPDEALIQIDSSYTNLVDTLIDFELFLCRTLKFRLNADHGHKYLLHYLKSLSGWLTPTDNGKGHPKVAWFLLNDSYLTSMCIRFRPDYLAVTACYIALKIYGISCELEQHANKPWWKVFVDDIKLEDINNIGCEMMELYNSQVETIIK